MRNLPSFMRNGCLDMGMLRWPNMQFCIWQLKMLHVWPWKRLNPTAWRLTQKNQPAIRSGMLIIILFRPNWMRRMHLPRLCAGNMLTPAGYCSRPTRQRWNLFAKRSKRLPLVGKLKAKMPGIVVFVPNMWTSVASCFRQPRWPMWV